MRPILNVLSDLRLAARTLARSVGFTAMVILALGIGLGANISAFSAFDAVFARDLPVREPEELVTFHWLRTDDAMVAAYSGYGRPGPGGTGIRTSFSPVTFDRFRRGSRTLSDVFAFADRFRLSVTVDGLTELASGQVVSGNYYGALGVSAFKGRVLTDADDGPAAAPVAVITFRYWQRRFASDAEVVGRTVRINGSPVTIVGISQEGFDGTLATESSDFTLPLAHAGVAESTGRPKPPSTWWLRLMGRLRTGASLEQVETDLHALFETSVHESWAMRPSNTQRPDRAAVPALRIVEGRQGPDGPRRDAMADLAVALAVGGTILVVGCANVATLLLVRGLKRRQEIVVRLALGATRMHILRLLLSESVVLSFGGGALGILFAYWGKNFLAWLPASSAPIIAPAIDSRALVFGLGLSVLTAACCGLAPALQAVRRSQVRVEAKKRSWRRLAGRVPIIVQVAGSVVFLSAASLAARSLHDLNTTALGFDSNNLIVFRLSISEPAARIVPSPFEALSDVLEATPGVVGATFSAMPLVARSEWTETVQSDSGKAHDVHLQVVAPNFFETIATPVMLGRSFSSQDRRGQVPVAVVNARMAREIFGQQPAIGRYLRLETGSLEKVPRVVIGVVGDAKYSSLESDAPATLYLPATQVPPSAVSFEVRVAGHSTSLLPTVRDVVSSQLPGVAIASVKTMVEQIDEVTARPRQAARVAGVFGLVAVLLACVGLFGVVSYDVTQRTRELGVRVALGATQSQIAILVVRDILVVIAIGSVAGVAIAISAAVAGQQFFAGLRLLDSLALLASVAMFALIASAAVLPPALRAARLAPSLGLREN